MNKKCINIDATYSIGSYWGPVHRYREVPLLEISAVIHRKGRRYEAKMSFVEDVTYQAEIWPRPRARSVRADIGAQLRALADTQRTTAEYAAKVVEWQRANLQRAVRVSKDDVEFTAVTLKVKRQKLAESRRKLKAFERKNP